MNKSSPIPEFRVLIVEDDSATRLLLKKVVTKAGYFTDEASSAEVALELIQKNTCYPKPAHHSTSSASKPDVIVSHHPAPQKSGPSGTLLNGNTHG